MEIPPCDADPLRLAASFSLPHIGVGKPLLKADASGARSAVPLPSTVSVRQGGPTLPVPSIHAYHMLDQLNVDYNRACEGARKFKSFFDGGVGVLEELDEVTADLRRRLPDVLS